MDKIKKVMHEFKQGSLKSSSGDKVTSRDQALAIAMSEAGKSKKKKKGPPKNLEELRELAKNFKTEDDKEDSLEKSNIMKKHGKESIRKLHKSIG